MQNEDAIDSAALWLVNHRDEVVGAIYPFSDRHNLCPTQARKDGIDDNDLLLRFGAHITIGAETIIGCVTIKTDDGTTRKLVQSAQMSAGENAPSARSPSYRRKALESGKIEVDLSDCALLIRSGLRRLARFTQPQI